jgi:hypothetical protein
MSGARISSQVIAVDGNEAGGGIMPPRDRNDGADR